MSTYLQQSLAQLESHLPHMDRSDPKVSRQSVGWQVHHSLQVLNTVLTALEKSDPAAYKPEFHLLRYVLLTLGWFPRGKAKAPKAVRPPETFSREDIERQLQEAREHLSRLDALPARSHFPHPYFGSLNKTQTVRFLGVHTRHHLKIVEDILG